MCPLGAISGSWRAFGTSVDFAVQAAHPPGMFWHLLLVLCSPFASLLSGLLRDDRDRQILALRQQIIILYGDGSFQEAPALG